MKKYILMIFLITLCLGYASLEGAQYSNKYVAIYHNAVLQGTSTIIIKTGDFPEIRKRTLEIFESLNYKKAIFTVPEQGLAVMVKDNTSAANLVKSLLLTPVPCQIILKFSKFEPGKTRIDLVRASDNGELGNKEVEEDIEKLAQLIKND